MLTESAQISVATAEVPNFPAAKAALKRPSDSEIHSLHECDPALPAQIRANFKVIQEAKAALFKQLGEPWNETTDDLFLVFEQNVRHHLRVVSEKMYVPVKKRLRVERSGNYERFKIFEERARKTNALIAVLLKKYHRSNQFFNADFAQDLKTDLDRVVSVLNEQINRERAYLFPVYLTNS